MSLDFLLGFTGVLRSVMPPISGWAPMARRWQIKYLVPEHAVRRRILGRDVAAAIIGALIVRRRGVYFAMVTIAFGQVFYFIAFRWNAVTGGDDGLNGWHRMPIDLGLANLYILWKRQGLLLFHARDFRDLVAIMAAC